VTPRLRTLTDLKLTKSPLARGIVIAALVLAEGTAIAVVVPEGLAERRIGEALAAADPCVEPSAADMEVYGTDQKKAQVQTRKTACAEQTYNAHCDAVAADIDAKKVTDKDFVFVKSQAAFGQWARDLVQRLGAGKFGAADLHTSEADLPCGDKIWSRVVKAAATTPTAWSLSSGGTSLSISDDMKMALAQARADSPGALPKGALSADVQRAIQVDEDILAQPALTKARTDDMAAAQSFCELGTSLRVAPTDSCVALGERYALAQAHDDKIAAAAQASQEARERAEQVRDDAKKARCQAVDQALSGCLFDHCMDIDLFDPRADRCQSACERRFPKNGCE
jgi:hypothetical protein